MIEMYQLEIASGMDFELAAFKRKVLEGLAKGEVEEDNERDEDEKRPDNAPDDDRNEEGNLTEVDTDKNPWLHNDLGTLRKNYIGIPKEREWPLKRSKI